MTLKAKRIIFSILTLSLLANLLLVIYVQQIKINTKTNKEEIVELEKENKRLEDNNDFLLENNEYLKKQYRKYFELSEELQNQMGVYYDY
ncbi:hypothetical protein [Erysipelatoclostridium sp. An173]|uniref:hypothetical protein n=1 Tax=Erysipelatoclostridium sp. An173 TaxID=1965571 RepID=UPI00320ABEEC